MYEPDERPLATVAPAELVRLVYSLRIGMLWCVIVPITVAMLWDSASTGRIVLASVMLPLTVFVGLVAVSRYPEAARELRLRRRAEREGR